MSYVQPPKVFFPITPNSNNMRTFVGASSGQQSFQTCSTPIWERHISYKLKKHVSLQFENQNPHKKVPEKLA